MSLPKGFKRLEYIQSSGTQYVDTLFAPNQNTRVVADVQMMSEVSSGGANEIFGARTSASSKAYAVQWNTIGDMFQHFYNAGYDNLDFGNFSERQIVETNKNVLLINGVTHERPYAAFQCDYTLYLCAVNQENAAKFFSAMRVYVCQIYDNGTLVRDFIPCQNGSGAVGLWDAVNEEFYGNAGTGVFIAGPVVPEQVDESEITELEYIQSNGTQYFKTGFFPTSKSRVVMDFEALTAGVDVGLCGARTSNSSKAFCFWFYTNYITSARFDYFKVNSITTAVPRINERITLDMNQNACVCDNFSETQPVATFQCDYDLALFGVNTAGTVGTLFTGKLYSCQTYEVGFLERDFVPAMLENGEVGLYDRVFHAFYRNVGTGEFIAGPEMAHEGYTELEYIESDGTQCVDTGVVGNQSIGFEVDFETANSVSSSGQGTVLGCLSSTSARYEITTWTNNAYGGQFCFGANTYDAGITQNIRMTMALHNGALTTPRGTVSVNTSAFSSGISIALFGRHCQNVGFDELSETKIYYCRFYDEGADVRVYIPMVHSSGVAGLWDSVNERFYASATTADFIAGPEVSKTPNAPSTFQLDSVNDTSIVVSWQTVANALGYKLWLNSSLIADTTETTVTVTVEPFTCMVLSLVAYNEHGNSPVVTLTHQYAPDNPILWLVTDRTTQDVALGNTKGTYNASDLNRVGYAVAYLADKLASCGVKTTVYPKTDWVTTDIPSERVLMTYLQNVRTLRTALTLVASVPEVPQDMQFFTHTEANSIEMLLVMLDTHITNMLSNVDTSWAVGSTYTGLYAKEAYR